MEIPYEGLMRPRFRVTNLVLIVIRGLLQGYANLNVGFIAYYSMQAGASVGVMMSVVSLSTFFVALAFYCLFNESLNHKHLIGMVFIVTCAFLISISKNDDTSIQGDQSQNSSILIPLALALFQCIMFTLTSILLRVGVKRGFSSLQFSFDMQLWLSIIYFLLFLNAH
jgi:drug/metabolite transporter (DMT)-like permease